MAIHYVLAHLTAAPVDGKVTSMNVYERIFTMFNIVASLLVLGTVISKISQTIQEIHRAESDHSDARCRLRKYFQAMDTQADLSMRVLHFIHGMFKNQRDSVLDPTVMQLLSPSLAAELIVNARSKYLVIHPLFGMIEELFDVVYIEVCNAFDGAMYAEQEVVFKAGTWSVGLHLLVHGECVLLEKNTDETTASCPAWFSEISLFARILHKSTLVSVSFVNGFFLGGRKFGECVKQSPSCLAIVIEYAREYLSNTWDGEYPSLLCLG